MHHRGACDSGRLSHPAGPQCLDGIEGLGATLGQDADQIDGGVGIPHRRLDRSRIAQISLHGVDLADPAERL